MPHEISPIAQLAWIGRALAGGPIPLQVQHLTKAAVGAVVTDPNNTAVAIGPFSDAMASRSAFFRLMSDNAVMRTPMLVRSAIMATVPTAAVVGEGRGIPLTKPALSNITLQPTRVASMIVCTRELLQDLGSAGQTLFSGALANALADAVDNVFLAALLGTGVHTAASTGSSAVNAYTDLRNAMLAVDSGAKAKLYWLLAADTAKRAAGLADSAGSAAFSAMSPMGGEMCGLPCIVSDGLTAGTAVLLDATGVAADATAVAIDTATSADIQMTDTPTVRSDTPTGTTLTSLFQTNSVALRASVVFGAELLRTTALAQITGIAWGGP